MTKTSRIFAAVVLALGVWLVPPTATAADKQSQTIDSISIEPAIGSGSNTQQLYFVSATSTSGLPVTVTVDPASADVCGYSPSTDGPTWVQAHAPGACIVHFDQAGDDTYLPAAQVTRTIQVNKDVPALFAEPAQKGVLGLTPTKFVADLCFIHHFCFPLYGETVTFSVAGKVVCSAVVTVAKGNATCSAPIGVANAFKVKSYTASFGGSKYYEAATATGQLKP